MQPKFQSHEKNTHDKNFKGVLQRYTQLKFSIVC
jgi:hypothetical protein